MRPAKHRARGRLTAAALALFAGLVIAAPVEASPPPGLSPFELGLVIDAPEPEPEPPPPAPEPTERSAPAPAPIQPAPVEPPPESHRRQRPADDFRSSDPEHADLAPVAESSGLSSLSAAQDRGEVLELAEVLEALIHLDPRLEAAQFELEKAEAKLLSARGGFDTKVKFRGLLRPLSYYPHGIADVMVEQPTPLWGLGVWTGWRVGLGDFAVYDGKLQTAAGGEIRAGLSLPLWRDGPIDRRRADIRQAKLEREAKLRMRDAKLLELEAKAAEAYWKWVAAGLILDIERTLLELALERDVGLERQIELGGLEEIVGRDNDRLIVDREGRVVAAEREFQSAVLTLAMFFRDAEGDPQLAGADRLPRTFPRPAKPEAIDIEAEVEAAIARRPDLAAVQASRGQAEIEMRWAKNQRAPRIDLSSWVAKDLGPGPEELLPVEVVAMAEIELAIPMRKARGQYQAARAELGRVDANLRLARDQIRVDVLDAHSAVAAAYQRARLAGEQVDLARQLADAELRRFQLGAGDLLLVNLRELATTKAAADEVKALEGYFSARARLEAATGEGVQPVPVD